MEQTQSTCRPTARGRLPGGLLALMLLAGGAAGALHASTGLDDDPCATGPDLILYNGTILTMDDALPVARALAVRGETIQAVGTDEEILALLQPGCAVRAVDLRGRTVLPGFNDSHEHWFSWREHICSVSPDTTYPPLEEIMTMLSAEGWTSISELNFGRPDVVREHLDNALDLERRGMLSVRVNGYWGTLDDPSLIQALEDSLIIPRRAFSRLVRTPGVKMYVDDPFGTTDIMSQQQVSDLVMLAHSRGWQVAAHAVNESAVEKILRAYEQVLGSESNDAYRHRIEHAVKVSDGQLERMTQKGIIASFQLLGPPDWPAQTTFQTYLSNTNPEWCLRWKDFDEAIPTGLRTAGSTDAPFNDAPCDYSPFRVIHQAVTREGYLSRTRADWELAQRLTVASALRLLTIDGAYATFEEDIKGSLRPGKLADLVVLSGNPLEIATPDDLLGIRTRMTLLGGEARFCDEPADPDFCEPRDAFTLDSALVSSSGYIQEFTPDRAFDADPATGWSAGSHPPQWIQIDLLGGAPVTGIDLTVSQDPAGRTAHQIYGRRDAPDAMFEFLHEFSGDTEEGQVLTYTSPPGLPPYRYIRILTTESPSWVAWQDVRLRTGPVTSTGGHPHRAQREFALRQNYPNPFNPSTIISYDVAEPSRVRIAVYDLLGREVAVLVDERKDPGVYQVRWEPAGIAGGVYVYRLEAGTHSVSRKLVILQ